MKNLQRPELHQALHVELQCKVNIIAAPQLHLMLLAGLAAVQPFIVNGSRVEEIDTAILQLLVSLWCTTRERGIECRWNGVSEPLRRAATLIGVAGLLQLPDARETSGCVDAA